MCKVFYALHVYSNDQSEEHLEWCREPFMEALNEIEALNDIRN